MIRLALVALLAGCFPGEAAQEYITVTSIQVDETEGNLSANLEVEVHIYDLDTEQLLGCAELTEVERGSVRYEVDGFFQVSSPPGHGFLRLMDIEDRDVYVWAVERDRGSCPDSITSEDDIIGRSLPFAGATLAQMQDMQFEYVDHIRIGTERTSRVSR